MFLANEKRYQTMPYRRAGESGLLLPAISLGMWHNFSQNDSYARSKDMLFTAFDNGITHIDLANNYGPPPGDAEITFGKIISTDLKPYRDELIISNKAGHEMWSGPYGDWGSRKSLIASCDQSLRRMKLDYVDIFYSHRYDPSTPLEETMCALDQIVRSGKALYVSLSKYPAEPLAKALDILRELRTPVVLHQVRYSMLNRVVEDSVMELHKEKKIGCISFSPLAQGMLSSRYLNGIPADSRAAIGGFLKSGDVEQNHEKILALNEIAQQRGQTLSQMAIAWQLHDDRVTSVIIGASSSAQIIENLSSLENLVFSSEELAAIDKITKENF
ncbi:MAG: aldo/keto reductase [Rikenellaceae bacterium]